jgi:hypothetical protein
MSQDQAVVGLEMHGSMGRERGLNTEHHGSGRINIAGASGNPPPEQGGTPH